MNNCDINENDLNKLRLLFKKNDLGEIFILSSSNDYKNNKERKISNGIYYATSYSSLKKIFISYNLTFGFFYTQFLYYKILEQIPYNSNIFRTSIPMTKFPINININNTKTNIYEDYCPAKFYFLNKIIVHWTKQNYNKDNQYIFIDGFKDLEYDNILGYANINSFSKALFELPFINQNKKDLNLVNLKKDTNVLVQAHIYYTDLIMEVINKTNNIPVLFDLYVTTNAQKKKQLIEKKLIKFSKANKYEILIISNKGRDVIPCLIQLKNVITKYKYFCHIHTKKHDKYNKEGNFWRIYLFENLLGNKTIIQQILYDFENNDKLGFIFPEHFYKIIKNVFYQKKDNLKHVNNLLKILFPKKKIKARNINNFPSGNMFLARTNAIYQIFNEKIIQLAPIEKRQYDCTILHGIERIWLYLVKLNGFFYKTILYYI